jgi:hypothetical protein
MKGLLGTAGAVGLLVFGVGAVSGCGGSSKKAAPASGTDRPTISMWVSGSAGEYRQLSAGVKLALSEAQADAGKFRINFAGREISDDPTRAEADALANARMSLQDTQVSGVVVDAPPAASRPAITLLNEAGIPTVAIGDAALKTEACSAGSDIYPAGHKTAIVVLPSTPPASWSSSFSSSLGFKPTATAWRAYQGTTSLLASIATPGVATTGNPPRLNRDTLVTALVSGHSDC